MPTECPEKEDVIAIVRLCSRIILESGGETYRAEETVYRICKAFGYEETDVIAIPTGVYICFSKSGEVSTTTIKRIRKRGVNLTAIEEVNSISRLLTAGKLSVPQALTQLREICTEKPQPKIISILAAGFSSGFFALLFKGGIFDFIAATLCAMVVQLVATSIKTDDMFNFAVSILGGFLMGVGSIFFVKITGVGDLQKIITGAMMPLLPGISMTNAIRDTMRGDLVSGVARAAEALLIAVALAFGVGVVLKLYLQFLA